ncbi:MAG: folylpolyglutamate synthase/dihydrofolate synthase family protein [Oscillospiraceae bacterium]
MTLTEALSFLHGTAWLGSRLGLERTRELLRRLGDPQEKLRFVHVAGTNGKGSVCAMLAAIFTDAGYRTGLYTSPHLFRLNERLQIDGVEISDADLIALVQELQPAVAAMSEPPTEFELITAMALLYFSKQQCQLVVLEVGLGGRLDATNAISTPEVAVITHISLEHTEILGDTVEKIAGEKAGIIKEGGSVVLFAQTQEAEAVIRQKCQSCHAVLRRTAPELETLLDCSLEGQTLDYRARKQLRLRLLGTYQFKNVAPVLDAVDAMIARGWSVPESAIRSGLARVSWPGRFELLQKQPPVLVDGAHNPGGAAELAQCLDQLLPGKKLTFVVGVMADKDYSSMLKTLLPYARRFITVTPDSERALPSASLQALLQDSFQVPAYDGKTVQGGISYALDTALPDSPLCIFGSLYQVGEARAYFGKYEDPLNH